MDPRREGASFPRQEDAVGPVRAPIIPIDRRQPPSNQKTDRQDNAQYTPSLGCASREADSNGWRSAHEIRHRADSKKNEGRIQTRFDSNIQDVEQTPVMEDLSQCYFSVAVCVPELRVIEMGSGEIRQQHAERYSDEEQRFELFDDTKIKQDTCERDHNEVFRATVRKTA